MAKLVTGNLKDRYGPWALIAGGSEGVGVSFARKLAADGINLILVARKPEPLAETAAAVSQEFGVEVRTLGLDLTTPDAVERVRRLTDNIEVGMLVYNAGTDNTARDMLDRPLSGLERVIALNVLGQTRFVHHYGAAMRARGRGGIILVGSLLAYAGGGGMSVYAAAKSFSHTLAKGLWYELRPHGIDVLGLVLSATKTPAAYRLGLKMDDPVIVASEPDAVAQEGLDHLGKVPLWIVSDAADFAAHIRSLSDADAVALVSRSAREMHGH
jgi:short-subunit dehydrogenase